MDSNDQNYKTNNFDEFDYLVLKKGIYYSVFDLLSKSIVYSGLTFAKFRIFGVLMKKGNLYGFYSKKLHLGFSYDEIQVISNYFVYVKYQGYNFVKPIYEKEWVACDSIESLGESCQNLLIIKIAGTYGLLNNKGQMILAAEFDSIKYNNQLSAFILLKKGYYGAYLRYKEALIECHFPTEYSLINKLKEKC